MSDREIPVIAGDVPIEFVVIREISDLVLHAIADDIGVVTVIEQHVFVADDDAIGVAFGFGVVTSRPSSRD